jgi:L-arabinose isomerase
MTTDTHTHQVWFLTGSQALYGEHTLRQVAEQSKTIAAALAAAGLPADIQWRPVLTDPDSIRRACLDATAQDSVIGVIAWMHTFSPAKMWIAGLSALTKPLLHLHTQLDAPLPWATIDMDFMNLNQAAHGDREFAHLTTRLNLPRKTVAGHTSDPRLIARIESWTRAALARTDLATLKLARFGDNMRQVAVTEGDKVDAQIRLGASTNTYAVNDLAHAVDHADEHDIDTLVTEYQDTYTLDASLRPGAERHHALRYAARIEAGLRTFLTQGGFGAFTTNFEDLGPLRQLPGIAVQRLMADGYGFGAEGDWKTALLLRALKTATKGQPGGTSFMEDYTYHLEPGHELILGAHMLEVCPTIAATRPTCEIHPLGIGNREDPVRLVFDATPGPALVAGLTDLGDRLRIVANEIDIVTPPQPLPKLPVARAVWAPRPNWHTSVEAWLTAGAPHHTVLTTAPTTTETLTDLTDQLGIELLTINAHTNTADFTREMRWNQAYHHLARGL